METVRAVQLCCRGLAEPEVRFQRQQKNECIEVARHGTAHFNGLGTSPRRHSLRVTSAARFCSGVDLAAASVCTIAGKPSTIDSLSPAIR
jgi:hypothetical protein